MLEIRTTNNTSFTIFLFDQFNIGRSQTRCWRWRILSVPHAAVPCSRNWHQMLFVVSDAGHVSVATIRWCHPSGRRSLGRTASCSGAICRRADESHCVGSCLSADGYRRVGSGFMMWLLIPVGGPAQQKARSTVGFVVSRGVLAPAVRGLVRRICSMIAITMRSVSVRINKKRSKQAIFHSSLSLRSTPAQINYSYILARCPIPYSVSESSYRIILSATNLA